MNFTEILLNELKKLEMCCSRVDENGNNIDFIIITYLEEFNNNDLDLDDEDEKKYRISFTQLNNFFNRLPKSIWEKESIEIAQLIFDLQFKFDLHKDNIKKFRNGKKPKLAKEQDITALNNAFDVLEKFLTCKIGNKEIYSIKDIPSDFDIPKKFYNNLIAFDVINVMLFDLKKGKYDSYYEFNIKEPSKNELKVYLSKLNDKYEAKGTYNINKFITNLKI